MSLSVIVPRPESSEIVAFVAAERFTEKVSLASLSVSPSTWTVTCFAVSPGLNVRVPLVEA